MTEDSEPLDPHNRSRLSIYFGKRCWQIGVLILVSIVFGFLGRLHFLPDLASHFRMFQTVGLGVCAVGLLLLKRVRIGLLFLVCTVGLLIPLSPYYLPRSATADTDDPAYRITTVNVKTSNRQYTRVIDLVMSTESDIVIFQETDAPWIDAINDGLSDVYPFHKAMPRQDNFGIILLSKFPITESSIESFSDFGLPSIVAEIDLPKKTVRVIATHPLPPMRTKNWKQRNTTFANVAKLASDDANPITIVAGDLNCTPWSYWFKKLLTDGNLSDSAIGNGLSNTWYPFPIPMTGLPIDHFLVGSDIHVTSRFVGPACGSDHRPVTMTFR